MYRGCNELTTFTIRTYRRDWASRSVPIRIQIPISYRNLTLFKKVQEVVNVISATAAAAIIKLPADELLIEPKLDGTSRIVAWGKGKISARSIITRLIFIFDFFCLFFYFINLSRDDLVCRGAAESIRYRCDLINRIHSHCCRRRRSRSREIDECFYSNQCECRSIAHLPKLVTLVAFLTIGGSIKITGDAMQ